MAQTRVWLTDIQKVVLRLAAARHSDCTESSAADIYLIEVLPLLGWTPTAKHDSPAEYLHALCDINQSCKQLEKRILVSRVLAPSLEAFGVSITELGFELVQSRHDLNYSSRSRRRIGKSKGKSTRK